MIKHPLLYLFVACCWLTACKPSATDDYKTRLVFGPGQEDKITEAFLSLKDSSAIELKAGTYRFDNLSIAQLKHILIQGAGPDSTILDFSSQTSGGEGIRVTDVQGFTIKGMVLQNAKGDLIKINRCQDVVVSGLHAIWQVADSNSGGYAIYPVLCKNVLIEDSYAEGASDAGIYVGQTQGAIVRNCKASRNVAGCEIENTQDAQVYDNEFYGNTAGFLVFDLPNLSQRGGRVRAFHNNFHDNNTKNFAKSGNFGTYWGVGNAPPGSGVVILSTSHVDLDSNQITHNNSSAIIIASGLSVDDKAMDKINAQYFPIPGDVHIYGNVLSMDSVFPAPVYEHHVGKMLVAVQQKLGARIPLILYDGVSSNIISKGAAPNPDSIYIQQSEPNLFVNADLVRIGTKDWNPNTNAAPFRDR